MKIRTFLVCNLIALFRIFKLGCSKNNLVNGTYIFLGDSVTKVPAETIVIHPYLRNDLILSKEEYESGDMVKILFAVYPTTVTDGGTEPLSELIFPNQEKLG